MSWRKRGAGGKRDSNEKPIVDALRASGARVWFLSGQGNPDLLVLAYGRFVPLETKQPKGTRTKNQLNIPWAVVRTPEEALKAIGAIPQDCEGIDPEPQ